MALSLSRWRPRHLLLSWIGYWAVLFAVTLGPAALTAWRFSRDPDARGSISASVENLIGQVTIVADGATVWSGSAHLLTASLWVVGPPLALWLAWMIKRPKRRAGRGEFPEWQGVAPLGATPAALREPDPTFAGSEARTTRPDAARVTRTPGRGD